MPLDILPFPLPRDQARGVARLALALFASRERYGGATRFRRSISERHGGVAGPY